jgi:hypothetical protein
LAAAGRVATGRVAADTVSMRKAAMMARRRIELVFIFVIACYFFRCGEIVGFDFL